MLEVKVNSCYQHLERQKQNLLDYAKSRGYNVLAVLEDVASGLNENRKSLNKLFDIVEGRKIGVVVVAFKDRLTRFGFGYLERCFPSHGVRIEVVNGEQPKDAYQELVEDFSFSIEFCWKALRVKKPQVREGG